MAYLVVSINGKEICRRELSGPVTLGRSTECDLWLNDAGVSRRHCRFEPAGEGWQVVDLGSRNGVVVHGERVTKRTLADGEAVHVGGVRITFHAVGYVSSRPSRPGAPQGVDDSVSDTIIAANSASRMGRALPTPRVPTPGGGDEAPKAAAPLAFTRPPARPIPTAAGSIDESGNGLRKTNADHPPRRAGLLRRFLHK